MSLENFKKRAEMIAKHMNPKRLSEYLDSFEYNFERYRLSNGTDEVAERKLTELREKDFQDRKKTYDMLYESAYKEYRDDMGDGVLFAPACHEGATAFAEKAMVDDGLCPPHFTKLCHCSGCGGVFLPEGSPKEIDSCIWCSSPKFQSWLEAERGN